MTIWIDITHIPQYNFYRNFIRQLVNEGHNVEITVLRRGKTPLIIRNEMQDLIEKEQVRVYEVGRHSMKKWSVVIEANILRLIALIGWRMRHRVDLAYGNGMLPAMVQAVFGGPSYSFDDDPQTVDFRIKARYNTECNFCLYEDAATAQHGGNVQVLRCLKEWAYLAPNVFEANADVLKQYGLQPKRYIFLREVTVGTFNYSEQAPQAILAVKEKIAATGLPVVFSLEEKHRRADYPADWILLQEPVTDIHSLIYYAAGLISSGDSMAREAALLGIPSYYLGTRSSMPANRAAAQQAGLQSSQTMPFDQWLTTLHLQSPEQMATAQQTLRAQLDTTFIDINAYMMRIVNNTTQK